MSSKISQSTVDIDKNINLTVDIDLLLSKLRNQLRDPELGRRFVDKCIKCLPMSEIMNAAEFAAAEGHHPGRLFVSLMKRELDAQRS